MKRKELTKKFMIISNWKKPFWTPVYIYRQKKFGVVRIEIEFIFRRPNLSNRLYRRGSRLCDRPATKMDQLHCHWPKNKSAFAKCISSKPPSSDYSRRNRTSFLVNLLWSPYSVTYWLRLYYTNPRTADPNVAPPPPPTHCLHSK